MRVSSTGESFFAAIISRSFQAGVHASSSSGCEAIFDVSPPELMFLVPLLAFLAGRYAPHLIECGSQEGNHRLDLIGLDYERRRERDHIASNPDQETAFETVDEDLVGAGAA